MAGLGATPIGSTPFGAGTPIEAVVPPEAPLASSRFINPDTKDYETQADGEYKSMPTVRQRAVIALSTTLGSSAGLQESGLRLPDRIDERYNQRAYQAIRRALAFMTDPGEMRIDGITTPESQVIGRTEHIVAFTDLTTGNADTLTV
jgi:hypothetical protein